MLFTNFNCGDYILRYFTHASIFLVYTCSLFNIDSLCYVDLSSEISSDEIKLFFVRCLNMSVYKMTLFIRYTDAFDHENEPSLQFAVDWCI